MRLPPHPGSGCGLHLSSVLTVEIKVIKPMPGAEPFPFPSLSQFPFPSVFTFPFLLLFPSASPFFFLSPFSFHSTSSSLITFPFPPPFPFPSLFPLVSPSPFLLPSLFPFVPSFPLCSPSYSHSPFPFPSHSPSSFHPCSHPCSHRCPHSPLLQNTVAVSHGGRAVAVGFGGVRKWGLSWGPGACFSHPPPQCYSKEEEEVRHVHTAGAPCQLPNISTGLWRAVKNSGELENMSVFPPPHPTPHSFWLRRGLLSPEPPEWVTFLHLPGRGGGPRVSLGGISSGGVPGCHCGCGGGTLG